MNTLIETFDASWLYIALLIGIALAVLLVRNWNHWNWIRRLTALAVITLILHGWEEWKIPGGFFYLYNMGSYNYPMSQLTDSITVFSGIVVGTIVVLWGGNKISSIAIIGICLIEMFGHLVNQPLNMHSYFNAIYNPGMATTICGFLPVAIGLIICLKKDPPRKKEIVLGLAAFVLVNVLTVAAPEAIFKDENTPYGFTDKRYFNQFETLLPNDPENQTSLP